ncbi:uncharacterized protein C8Q71DRAFT_857122 [Rhodofomes roseus]|uniref:Ribosomal RNA methyltransferase FtsJ domain-containing protein n=1 Tax=Rhodofomes roseus TaxID=34475 RepID=A0ABQ8KK35_9APHY|nr:uncharacterized protein C8Q71DRAFT_857122 [Rhodofomes roseus]KAH9837952.1 hypothetical protein C8Q71DRAFT_857122 [Rhodofomes roseus]
MALITREAVSRFRTIADVDERINHVLTDGPHEIISTLSPAESRFCNAAESDILRRLLVLKELYRLSDAVDRYYIDQSERNRATRADPSSLVHLEAYEKAFKEINELAGRPFGRNQVRKFLDLGFAPGGFATWLLRSNGSALGTGITLSPEASGIQARVDLQFLERFQQHDQDVRQIADGQVIIGDAPAAFDLIIANATVVLPEDNVPWNEQIHLTFAQLLVALRNIAAGGSLVISLRTRPFEWINDIIIVLTQCFKSVVAVKPAFQGRRSIAYIVCRDYTATGDVDGYIERLRAGIRYLKHITGSVDNPSGGTARLPRLSGLSDQAIWELHGQSVAACLTPVWKRQYDAVYEHYKNILEKEYGGGPTTPASNTDTDVSWRRQQAPAVQPSGADSSNWRNRTAEQHGSSQRRRDSRTAGSSGEGASGSSWRRAQH